MILFLTMAVSAAFWPIAAEFGGGTKVVDAANLRGRVLEVEGWPFRHIA